jgi:hypothetical protein
MKRIMLVLTIGLMAACKNAPPPPVVAERAVAVKEVNPDSMNVGTWGARVVNVSADKGETKRIAVTGSFSLEKPKAQVTLTKVKPGKQSDPAELVLNLSKLPTNKTDNIASVNYDEDLKGDTGTNYKKVRVLYHDRTVATISNIQLPR